MPSTFEIQELPDEVTIHVTEARHLKRVFLGLVVGSIAVYIFARFASGSRLLQIIVVGFCAFSMIRELLSSLRGTQVQLRVTNFDFISSGHAPGGYNPSVISRANISGIEFRVAINGGGEIPDLPRGLYVEHCENGSWNSATCVLPHIDKFQSEQVIEAICRRFPDTGTLGSTDGFESPIISLNLNRPF
jgi:hypothetical protein